jgi:hypothetical protein
MPRSGRGGKRQGTNGQAYKNRSDLTQAPTAAPGQVYGASAQQLAAQKTAPLPKQAPPAAPAPAGSAPAGPTPAGAAPSVQPGGLGAITAPTDKPNEPLTAGLASGPGPGPEALGQNTEVDPTLYLLKGLLSKYPNADVQALLNQAQQRHP